MGGEDRLLSKRVSYCILFNQIDLAAKNSFQFISHLDKIEQAAFGITLKAHQDVDVAVRSKVIGEDGAEKRQL